MVCLYKYYWQRITVETTFKVFTNKNLPTVEIYGSLLLLWSLRSSSACCCSAIEWCCGAVLAFLWLSSWALVFCRLFLAANAPARFAELGMFEERHHGPVRSACRSKDAKENHTANLGRTESSNQKNCDKYSLFPQPEAVEKQQELEGGKFPLETEEKSMRLLRS